MPRRMDGERVLSYVTGLLHFYGVICFEDLFNVVSEMMREELDRDDLRVLLEAAAAHEDGPYVLDMLDDYYFDIDVEDIDWVLEEQGKWDLPYRPITEEDARLVVEDQYPLLWKEGETAFWQWLQDKCDDDKQLAMTMVLEYSAEIKNGMSTQELVEKIVEKLALAGAEEVREAARMVHRFVEDVPRWSYKGWRPSEQNNH
ncbi:hypothetical protein [Dethiobacter alkaliphilus]|uniref:hypothetical protein n=1 Tax=Dethiobacter alkaliphilus TaxID=427926 RepID=UPI0022267262|nr:hypothetical protein [Dethiobacter alkaliphilus]MCW3490168.1 hypothetical protein [Dethiobacter alkaliphilus]